MPSAAHAADRIVRSSISARLAAVFGPHLHACCAGDRAAFSMNHAPPGRFNQGSWRASSILRSCRSDILWAMRCGHLPLHAEHVSAMGGEVHQIERDRRGGWRAKDHRHFCRPSGLCPPKHPVKLRLPFQFPRSASGARLPFLLDMLAMPQYRGEWEFELRFHDESRSG